ncbi:hypothetical protein KQX54_020078, partial [Cotesia glomerata]
MSESDEIINKPEESETTEYINILELEDEYILDEQVDNINQNEPQELSGIESSDNTKIETTADVHASNSGILISSTPNIKKDSEQSKEDKPVKVVNNEKMVVMDLKQIKENKKLIDRATSSIIQAGIIMDKTANNLDNVSKKLNEMIGLITESRSKELESAKVKLRMLE